MTTRNSDRERMTLDEIATAAAGTIADARAAGLTAPFSLTCHDYGPSTAVLYLYDDGSDTPGIRAALQQYADRYGTQVTTRPSTSPGSLYATAAFTRDGISYEVSAIIRPAPSPHQDDEPEQDQAA
jgi:hypothetical protein